MIEACRRRGINPFDYLRDVFTRMPTMAAKDYPGLAPEAWAKERTQTKPASKASLTKFAGSRQRHCVLRLHSKQGTLKSFKRITSSVGFCDLISTH